MRLLSPWSLLWLLPFWGAIFLLYILKLRRKDVEISSLYLWRQVVRDVQANAPFQKLRYNPLMLIQLLIALLCILALAQPVYRFLAHGGRTLVLVVDTGVTMQATEGSATRLDEAKRMARALVGAMRPKDRMILIAAGSTPRPLTGFTENRSELYDAIHSLHVTDAPTDMHAALQLAGELAATEGKNVGGEGSGGEVDLISDGCFTRESANAVGLTGGFPSQVRLRYYPVGKSRDNVGIVAFDYRRLVGYQQGTEVLAVTQNFSSEPRSFVEELYAHNRLVDAREVHLEPGATHTETYVMKEPSESVPLRLHLDINDDLSVDNTAYLVLAPKRLVKVLLTGDDNLFLEDALQVDPDIQTDYSSAYPGDAVASKYDVVIFYNKAPKSLPPGHYLFIHCSSNRAPVQLTGATAELEAIDWQHLDPVMRYVDLMGLRFGATLLAKLKPWAHEVVTGNSGALIVAGEEEKDRVLFYAFDPDQSRLPLSVAFPILISNSVRWLATGEDSTIVPVRAGVSIPLLVKPGEHEVVVRKPNGVVRRVAPAPDGRAFFDETDVCGLYTVEGARPVGGLGTAIPGQPIKALFAISLNDAAASDIAPVSKLPFELPKVGRASQQTVVVLWPLLPLLTFCVLCALVLEWYLFHRRPFFLGGAPY